MKNIVLISMLLDSKQEKDEYIDVSIELCLSNTSNA